MTGDGQQQDKDTVALKVGGRVVRLLKPGDVIGESYTLKGLLGRGGMGYVFRAYHKMMDQDYALKILAPDHINEVTWHRFQAEGKAIARLNHPNIVKIYNMGVEGNDFPYYVMDILEGNSLADCIAANMPLSVDEILDIFIQLAAGFGYAHNSGIVHRDVKPSNVMLIDTGGRYPTAKIVDFGIAKVEHSEDLNKQSLTATGDMFGSPYYMSPEQILGTQIDHRADIYSLGCTLFEALCGHPPFLGETAMQTVLMHQNQPSPTLESVGGKYSSDEMENLVAKMLAKRPADRYQSMDQVRHDLERVRQNKGVGKNVETGFITSADRQLDEIGDRLEEEKAGEGRRRKILVAVAFLTLVAAGIAAIPVFYFKPAAVNMAVTPNSSVPVGNDLATSYAKHDDALQNTIDKVAAVKTITSSIDKDTGKRVFHCPDAHMGSFCWDRKWLPENLDYHLFLDGRADAIGESAVPPKLPIALMVEEGRNREIYLHPQALSKFGPNELEGLKLVSRARLDEMGTDSERAFQEKTLLGLVKAVSNWTNLKCLEFFNVPLTDAMMDVVDTHKELRQLGLRGSVLNAKKLADMPFFKRLTCLELASLDDCDTVLSGLRDSKEIESILLLHCEVSARGLKALANCPNLKRLRLVQTQIDSPALEAITAIKALKLLTLDEVKLWPEQIPILVKLKRVPGVDLYIAKWPRPKIAELKALLPNANLMFPSGRPEQD